MSEFHFKYIDTTPEAPAPHYEVTIVAGSGDSVLLAGPCRHGGEVDEAIDQLITQLNAIRHKAKKKLSDSLRE